VPKGYWICSYREIRDAQKLAAYAKLAAEAVAAGGGRFLARAVASKVYDAGQMGRTTVVEFASLQQALNCREGAPYQRAVATLGDAVERDFRIVEGV